MKKNNAALIKELKSKIEMLEAGTNYKERFNDIEAAFDKMSALSREGGAEYFALTDYMNYLYDRAEYSKALEIAKELENIYNIDNNISPEAKAALWSTMGAIYNAQNKYKQCEEYYLRALQQYEELAEVYPDRYNPVLAGTYQIFGILKNNDEWLKKSYQLALKYPQDPLCQRIVNTSDFK